MLREIWGSKRWAGMSEERNMAEWLRLRGGHSDRQKGVVVEFLEQISSRGMGRSKGAVGWTWGKGG